MKNHRTQKLRERSEIPEKYQWNTKHIFLSDKEWEKKFRELQGMVVKLTKYQGKLGKSEDMLLECLETRDKIDIFLGKLAMYASLKSDEDMRITRYQAYKDRISKLGVEIDQSKSYIHPELLQIPEEQLDKWLESNPSLQIYQHYFNDLLRSKNHILNSDGEQLLALAGEMAQTPYQVFSMFNNADIKFSNIKNERGENTELTKGNFSIFIRSQNRDVRKKAFKSMYSSYQKWKNTLAANLAGAVKRDIYFARARKYNNALEASLDLDNIPTEVYDNVINTIGQNVDAMHKYLRLRKKVLKIKKVYPWDIYVPLVKEFKWEVSHEEALQTIEKSLMPLGTDYIHSARAAFTEGWFDVFESAGKRSGAYSNAVFDTPHPYVLLNYQGQLDDMFTMTHELGHSMHSYFTMKNQPYIYSNYTIFVAEVASTLNEALLIDYLLKNTSDPRKKIYLINHYIDQIKGTVYIQTMFAEFEKEIHEKAEMGEALTAQGFSNIATDIYSRYYGPDFVMDPLYKINWCRIPHFYYNFYVYQYATGLSAATALSQKILQGDTDTRNVYLEFLMRGSSDYSINLLKDAGVDMTKSEPIEATVKLFEFLIDEMEKLLREQGDIE